MRSTVRAMAMVGALSLGACAAAPPSPLSKDAIAKLRLDEVAVNVAPDAHVNWGNAENDYVQSAKGDPKRGAKQAVIETGSLGTQNSADNSEYAQIAATPEAKAYVRDKAAGKLQAALNENVKPRMQSGSQPVRLEVTIHSFQIPSAIQRVVIGGTPMVVASAELKDAATGAVLASRPNFLALAMAGSGWGGVLVDQAFDDLDVRVTRNYAESYRDWLLDMKPG